MLISRMISRMLVLSLIFTCSLLLADQPQPIQPTNSSSSSTSQSDVKVISRSADQPSAVTRANQPALLLIPGEGHREVMDDPPVSASVLSARASSPGRVATIGQFTSVQVNVDSQGNNIVGDAANEPSIAVDPTNRNFMAIGWRHFDSIASNFRQAGIGYSSDGGQIWTFPDVLDRGQFRSDPVLRSDASGIFYYSSLSTLSSIEVFRSFDGGMNWGLPVSAFGGDKQWIAVDRSIGIGRDTIYQNWNVQFTCCAPNDFTRSTDHGLFFEGPYAIGPLSMKWGTMDIGPDGRLYLAGTSLNRSIHIVGRSSNAGDPSETPLFDFGISVDLGGTTAVASGPNPAGLLGQIWIATDHSLRSTRGNVYVLASVDPPGIDPLDVMFIRSEDGGLTWSQPLRINDDFIDNGAWQWFGTMSVSSNGRIDVIWNDTRNTFAANLSETFYSFSKDGGITWSINVPLTPVFNSHLGWPQQNKIGDYYDMVSDVDGANLAYSATFNGEQDVYFLRIPADCDNNGILDDQDIASNRSLDCDSNGMLDVCQADGGSGCIKNLVICEVGRWDLYDGLYADVWADERNFVYLPNWGSDGNPARVHILDINDPTNPQLINTAFIPLPNDNASPQDVKVADGLLFVALEADANDGVAIVDVRDPANANLLATVTLPLPGFEAIHNVFIDSGFLYLMSGARIAIVDLTTFDPNNPPPSPITTYKWLLEKVGNHFVHDITVSGGRLYAAAWDSLQIYDVTNVATQAPVFLGAVAGDSVHSCWPTDDGQFVVTGEERPGGGIKVFRITGEVGGVSLTQTDNISLAGAFSTHNQIVIGYRVYNSWYERGLQIFDIDPVTGLLSFVAEFDTSDTGVGNWGVYPLLGDDRILLSDTDAGLFVVSLIPEGIECNCQQSSPPQAGTITLASGITVTQISNRALSIVAGDFGREQAIRVTFIDLPPPFGTLNGSTMWVQPPREICENSGQTTECLGVGGDPEDTFLAATLGCDPVYIDWSVMGVFHVFHPAIVPEGIYQVQVVDIVCNVAFPNSYSEILRLNTSVWGDVVSDCTTFPCGLPDGSVDVVTDVTSILDKFKNLPTAPSKVRMDIEPARIDFLINITDVTRALDAFSSLSYPFLIVPELCP